MHQPLSRRFIGRSAEVGALRAELEAALTGIGRLVLLTGEAGIGKTRTAAYFASEARDRGVLVAWGHAQEHTGSPGYWPWIQVFQACAEAPGGDAARALVPRLRPAGLEPFDAALADHARFELYHAAGRALVESGREQPLLVVLDDLQWADPGSVALLEYVARELAEARVLIVATLRVGAQMSDAPDDGRARAERLDRVGRNLAFAGLSAAEITELLGDELGRRPGAELANQAVDVTGGNPFYVIEMARLMASAPSGSRRRRGGPDPLPDEIGEILARRVAGIPQASREVLDIAAVLGQRFELAMLARVRGCGEREITAALEPGLALGVVREDPDALQSFVFAHALTRDALYGRLSRARRAELHLAVAEVLEALEEDASERLSELAHHFFEAARMGDPTRAARYNCEAGERSLSQQAFEPAIEFFERARSALALRVGADRPLLLRTVLGLATALFGAGQGERLKQLCAEATELARRAGPVPFAETVLQVAQLRQEFGILDVEMNTLLEEALSGLPSQPSPLLARLLAELAWGLYRDPGAGQRRRELSARAVDMATALADEEALGFTLIRRQMCLLSPDDIEERLATADEVLASKATPLSAELEARLFQMDDLAELADRAAHDAAFAAFEQKVEAAQMPSFTWQLIGARAQRAALEGRFEEAEALGRESVERGQRLGIESAGLRFAQQTLWMRGWQGSVAELIPMVERAVEQTRVVPAWRGALAAFYLHAGRLQEARREFEALAAHDFEDLPRDGTWFSGMELLASVCSHLGDTRRAEQLYALLRPFAGRIAVARPGVVMTEPIALRLGMLARTLGRYDTAEEHFEEALRVAERMRALPWQAEIRHQLAETLRLRAADGDVERALELLDEGEAIAREVGMELLVQWIANTRGVLDGSVASLQLAQVASGGSAGAVRTSGTVVPLTRRKAAAAPPGDESTGSWLREGEIWTLGFDGRSTRLRHMRGLAHLARLLAEPDHEMHALELAGAEAGTHARDLGDAGEQLDERARSEYRRRYREAQAELEEAERQNDRGRVAQVVREIELLTDELERAFGLGGRARRAGSASERARLSVTRAIKYAIDKIASQDPALAEHLRRSVRTGTYCGYEPSSRDRVTWSL